MNIEASNINQINKSKQEYSSQAANQANSSTSFADELKSGNKTEDVKKSNENISNVIEKAPNDIKDKEEINNAFDDLNTIVKELNQSDEKPDISIKLDKNNTDNNKKGEILINNDISINENKELMPQMNPNMNFSGNNEFSSLMQSNTENQKINSSAKDLAEEAEILSTMAENIIIANKKTIKPSKEEKPTNEQIVVNVKKNIFDQETKTVTRNNTVKKIDASTNITVENIVKYDSIIMNKADVEVFTQLVENKEINLKNLTESQIEKSVKVSKTLADMLVKSMENNKPLRIDFDNNISVIIKISKDGKISADFLPSSQVAEAYLKENLPLLRQKFDDNNIKYDELNQRERREHKEHSRKKGRDNE